jgi:Holliday junction resolvase
MNVRQKGKRAQAIFALMLQERDYIVRETNSGKSTEDLIAHRGNITYSVEVKDCRNINVPKFLKQARKNAHKSKHEYMLACHVSGTRDWLVIIHDPESGARCTVLREKA